MTTREEYQTIASNCLIRFTNLHPDCGFTADSFELQIVNPDEFIDAIMAVRSTKEGSQISRDECIRNHNNDDAILLRRREQGVVVDQAAPADQAEANERSVIILKYLPYKPIAMLLVTVYHELAHEYAIKCEEESGFVFCDLAEPGRDALADEEAKPELDAGTHASTAGEPQRKDDQSPRADFGIFGKLMSMSMSKEANAKGDRLFGYLLWKEFIADYLAYDALHHMMPRIKATGNDGVSTMAELLPRIHAQLNMPTVGAFASMANACAIIMNFDGFQAALHSLELKLPVNRRKRVGREFCDMFINLLSTLEDKLEEDDPFAIDDDFLVELGYIAVEVQLFHDDYEELVGWKR